MTHNQGNNNNNNNCFPNDTDNPSDEHTLPWELSRLSLNPPQPPDILIADLISNTANLSLTLTREPLIICVWLFANARVGIGFLTTIQPNTTLLSFYKALDDMIPPHHILLFGIEDHHPPFPPAADFPSAVLKAPSHMFSANMAMLEPDVNLWAWVHEMCIACAPDRETRRKFVEDLRLEFMM